MQDRQNRLKKIKIYYPKYIRECKQQGDESFKYKYVIEDKKTGARITQTYSLSVLFTYLEYKRIRGLNERTI